MKLRIASWLLVMAVAVGMALIMHRAEASPLADAAPPPEAAAREIAPGGGTQVQMVSETVVLDIRCNPGGRAPSDQRSAPTLLCVTWAR